MKRMVLVLTVALMMAAMIAANAMPAFAAGGVGPGGVGPCEHPGPAEDTSCVAFFQGQAHRK